MSRLEQANALYFRNNIARYGAGWYFVGFDINGTAYEIRAIGGSLNFDPDREVSRSISGITLLPQDQANIDFVADKVGLYLVLDGVLRPMGIFRWNGSVRRPAVILDPDNPGVTADLYNMELADEMLVLRASDGVPETVYAGADPSQEMVRYLEEAGVEHSVAGTVSNTAQTVTFDGGASLQDKILGFAELAGHRRPWMNNDGVFRSIASRVMDGDVLDLTTELGYIVAESIAITENYLSAPNRVIVSDNSGDTGYQIIGQWDAPGSAPHNAAKRGYVLTYRESIQGLGSLEHAAAVAETLGEQFTARSLSFSLARPTHLLDGPVTLSYDGAFWMVTNWSVNLDPLDSMQVNAIELVDLV